MNIINAFPTPIAYVENFLNENQIKILTHHVYKSRVRMEYSNITNTPNMVNDKIISNNLIPEILSKLKEFGSQLYGDEKMEWVVKNIWGNLTIPDGGQGIHNHANSVVSGIIYLTDPNETNHTTFIRNNMFSGYAFLQHRVKGKFTPYNRNEIEFDVAKQGDMVLFPSYLNHFVKDNNTSNNRITLSFNSFPTIMSVEGWYDISLS